MCRDCKTCTKPGFARMGQDWTLGFLHLCTGGMSWGCKRGFARHCPQCKHLMGSHQYRSDGSFRD